MSNKAEPNTVIISHEMCIKLCEDLTEFVRSHPWGEGWEDKAANVCWKISSAGSLFQKLAAERRRPHSD